MKFTSDLNGVIKGIRFYKSAANTGTHIGNLWTASGTKLASATFTGETASGWQQVNFATPVPVTAGTVYVASYFAPAGHYAGDGGYFAASGVDNAPLHALKDGVSGGNGVYVYGSASGFPNHTFNSENYWVDVVFSTGPATAPAAPTNVTATAGNASAQVTWTAPSDGGSPITSYTVTPFIGTTAQTPTTVTGSPPATTTTVTGLTNGTAYTFTVSADQRRRHRTRLRRRRTRSRRPHRPRPGPRPPSTRSPVPARRRCPGPRRRTAAARSPATRSRRSSGRPRRRRPP